MILNVLGKNYTGKLANLHAEVLRVTRKPIKFEAFTGNPTETLCEGECEWTKDGAVIRVIEGCDEYDCAHELAHALMVGLGYPAAKFDLDGDEAFKQAVISIGDSIHHPILHSQFLKQFGYEEEGKAHYQRAADEMWLGGQKLTTTDDDPLNFVLAFHATGLLELYYGARDRWEGLEEAFRERGARTWKLATRLVAATRNEVHANPHQIRMAIVSALGAVNKFIEEEAQLDVGLLKGAIVDLILPSRQMEVPAADLFDLVFIVSKTCFKKVALRLKRDGSRCHLWDCQNEQQVDWTKRQLMTLSAGEMLKLTDAHGFRYRLAVR